MSTVAPDLAVMARDAVTIAPFVGEDADGKPAYGAAVGYRARVVTRPTRIRNAQGQEIVAAGLVRLTRRVAVSTKDRLLLPGNVEAPILQVSNDPDELGRAATALYFGGAS